MTPAPMVPTRPSGTDLPAVPAQGGATQGGTTQGSADYDLARRQLAALDAWHARRRVQEEAAAVGERSREQRLDLSRRMDVIREQHRAIVARTDAHLRAGAGVLRRHGPRVLLVHRNSWLTDKVGQALGTRGAQVIAQLTNGAEAVGVALVEQPDLVLVEDMLPMLSGQEVVREVLRYSTRSLIVAHVAHDDGIAAMLRAGAVAAFPRRAAPVDLADGLLALLERQPA